jgi:hypothetical protein
MAKRSTRVLQARKEESAGDVDDSLLIRSAESLGRVIGSLQRQMRKTSKNLSSVANDAHDALPELPRFDDLFGGTSSPGKRAGAARAAGRKKTARKTAASRTTSKAGGARKTGGTRKSTRKR